MRGRGAEPVKVSLESEEDTSEEDRHEDTSEEDTDMQEERLLRCLERVPNWESSH